MKIEIKDIKRGKMLWDTEDRYRAYADAELVDGRWQVEVTTAGDYIYFLVEGIHEVWDNKDLT